MSAPRKGRVQGRTIRGGADPWVDGEDIVGILVSAVCEVTRHGERCCVTIDTPAGSVARWMPASWAPRLAPLAGGKIAIARDGEGLAARYDVRAL